MSILDRDDWKTLTPKDILHVWKYEENPDKPRQIVLYPIDFDQLAEAEAASQRGEKDVRIKGSRITLNSSASVIWEMCDGTHTIEQIIETLTQRFSLDCESAAKDVRRFFEKLEPYNVLEINWTPL